MQPGQIRTNHLPQLRLQYYRSCSGSNPGCCWCCCRLTHQAKASQHQGCYQSIPGFSPSIRQCGRCLGRPSHGRLSLHGHHDVLVGGAGPHDIGSPRRVVRGEEGCVQRSGMNSSRLNPAAHTSESLGRSRGIRLTMLPSQTRATNPANPKPPQRLRLNPADQ